MSRRARMLLLAVLLAAATVATYAPTFSAGFVDIDDADYVPENEVVKAGLRGEGVAWAFTGTHAGNWFPLTWLSHMADVELFGVEPGGHHGMNVALHTANALLLFGLLVALTGAVAPSFLVAALFALHPVQVESVAWISQRKTTLGTFFGILAIWGYARSVRSGGRWLRAASVAAFAASLLSKQTFVTLPFALLLLDYWPLRRAELEPAKGAAVTLGSLLRGWLRLLPEKVPYLLVSGVASLGALLAQGEAIATGETFPLPVRLGNALLSCVRYLGVLFWPSDLAVFYPLREEDVTPLRVVASGVLLVVLTGAAWLWGRRRRALLVGWLWFLGMLVPVIGLVQVGAQAMADRYLYVAGWGVALAVVWPAWEWLEARRGGSRAWIPAAAGAGVLLLALAFQSHRQARVWNDSVALFESAVRADPDNYVAHRALAGQYFNRGDYERALLHAKKGMEHPRDLGEVLPVYGMALFQTGDAAGAIARLEEATRIAPRSVLAFTNLAWIYLERGEVDLAAARSEAALRVDPTSARAAQLRATALLRLGRDGEAAPAFDRVIALDPLNFDARIERARLAARLGDVAGAESVLRKALDAARGIEDERRGQLVATLHLYLGDLYVMTGDGAGGAREYERALAAWPDHYAATLKLARLLAESTDPALRDPARAARLESRARALAPGGSGDPE